MTSDQQPPPPKPTGLSAFWGELRRRHVVRVAITYAVVAWLIIQIASSTFGWFDIPVWAYRFVVFMVILGFPLAVIVAWAFELTPEGIRTTKTARVEHPEAHKDETHAKKRHWFSLGVAAAVPAVIFGALAVYFYATRSAPLESELASTEQVELENEKSIAVLPLENLSPDPNNAFFADGVQEDILTNLSKIEELLVISRSSTLRYREREKSLREIGAELDVRYVVEGSVRRAANRVLVTVQLIEVETDAHLWAENYNRPLDDIFAIQAEVAKTIASQLQAVISPQAITQIERRPTESLEAYELFVKVRQMIHEGLSASRHSDRVALLEKAVVLDPSFAEAWAFLAWQSVGSWSRDYERNNPELLASAQSAMEEAIKFGPGLPHVPHAQSNFAYLVHDDYETSIEYLLEALAIDSSYVLARRALGNRYSALGRSAEAQHHYEEAVRMDPLSNVMNRSLLRIYNNRGIRDKARALIERNLERTGGAAHWRKSLAVNDYLESGDRDALFSAAIRDIPRYWNNPYDRTTYLVNDGEYIAALQSIEEAGPKNWRSLSRYRWDSSRTREFSAALIWFLIGDRDKWLAATEKAKAQTELQIRDDPTPHRNYYSNLVICHALEGNLDTMKASIEIAREMNAAPSNSINSKRRTEMDIAAAYLILGENDTAIEALEAASRIENADDFGRQLNLWFIFDRLRGNPRFDALLK